MTVFYLLLFATFTTKIVGFLYFFSTFSTKYIQFLNLKTTRLFFQTLSLMCFLQINLTLHTHIVLFDISMTYFLSFFFNKLQRFYTCLILFFTGEGMGIVFLVNVTLAAFSSHENIALQLLAE